MRTKYANLTRNTMACILNIDTSAATCSVALSHGGDILFEREDRSGHNHATVLAPFVEAALRYADSRDMALDAVAVSGGPGSYTGLRIGVSMAKGVCYGRQLPLVAVPTAELVATPVLLYHELADDGLLCPMIDARRMEVYAAIYDRALQPVRALQADVVTADTYKDYLDHHPVYFFGDGAAKCMTTINHPNAILIDNIEPHARNMFPLADKRLRAGQTEDVAYYVPLYLKDFIATVAKPLL